MSSHDELHKVLASAFEDLNVKLKEAESRAEEYRLELESRTAMLKYQSGKLNEVRSILAGDDGPEDKILSIEELLK